MLGCSAFLIRKRFTQVLSLIVLWVFLIVSLSACDQVIMPDGQAPADNNPISIQVDVLFSDFYRFLGGEEMLGEAISPMVEKDGRFFQYTMNALMVYDPSSPATEYFKLFPIGRELGIVEKSVSPPVQSDQLYVNGHIIGKPFQTYYNKMGSISYGAPLTEMFYNRLRNRYEQYFESVAFYQMKDSGEIGLLAYGSFMCADSCKKVEKGNSVFDYSYRIAPVFRSFVEQYGILFTGFPIGELYSVDGKWFQVFQNIVLMAELPENPQSVRLFSIVKNLGMMPENPLPPSSAQGMSFYSTLDGQGYEIPDFFWDYLVAHGGLQVSGAPVSHLKPFSDETLRQCFENLCLLYDQHAQPNASVFPDQLGYQYLGLLSDPGAIVEPTSVSRQASIVLRVEESQSTLSSEEQQEISVAVLRNGFPASGVALEVNLTMPDESKLTFSMPDTGADGKSSLTLPAILAENGSVILYQVCVINQEQANFCYEDSFAIWNQP